MNYDKTKYKIWTWKNPLMLHWIINPAISINELGFGQRMPKVTLIEKNSKKIISEKSFIPCPHCGTIHSGLKWTPQNNTAFGNWFGLYCDHCGKIIPCLTNLSSYILLILTFPVWYWFKDRWKAKWLEEQKIKFSKPLVLTLPDYNWWYIGLRFGLLMYIWSITFAPLIDGDGITRKKLLYGIPVWIIGGLIYGLAMKLLFSKKKV